MNTIRILVTAVAALAAGSAFAAGDPAVGKGKTFQCEGCHGIPGWKTAFPEVYQVPRLGGQHPAYIVSALKQYQKGDRDHATMRAIAAGLSEKDMEDIAAYYGTPAVTAAQK
jgi:cytochrome c553